MAYFKLAFIHLTVLLYSGAAGQVTGNFPLSDCHTAQFDIVLLQTRFLVDDSSQDELADDIADMWIQGNNNQSRALVSRIRHIMPETNENCSLKLTMPDGSETDLCSRFSSAKLSDSSLLENVKVKLQMTKMIFSDMGVGRQNSTHVAVLIYNIDEFLSAGMEEIFRIPEMLLDDGSFIKFCIIVHGDDIFYSESLFLRDTLLYSQYMNHQIVRIALCKHCPTGSFVLETADFLSCYQIHVSSYNINWIVSSKKCEDKLDQHLATVESREELDFLQTELRIQLLTNRPIINDSRDSARESAEVYIGLTRNTTSVARRFQWRLTYYERYISRPLVLNHWLPGHPVGGSSHACGFWFYSGVFNSKLSYDKEFGNISAGNAVFTENISNTLEGWSSVGCGIKLSPLYLCELTLSRRVKGDYVTALDAANKIRFNRALNSGDFQEYEGRIVSVSANIKDETFQDFMKTNNNDFPKFDCGISVTQNKYISYSYVSDNIKHCNDGQDEVVHVSTVCSHCQCILDEAMCDNVIDCMDGSDETDCSTCSGRRCCDGTCLPLYMFDDGEVDCSDCRTRYNITINDESTQPGERYNSNESCAFMCNRNQCIYLSQLNDVNIDCTGPEGHLDETIGKLERATSRVGMLGHAAWAPRCVYLRDRYGSILGFRDLSHLQNCSNFPCPEGYYKCPGRYCIPLHYVKDGTSDCPAGEEENHFVTYTCVGNFACAESTVCLHPDLVCDGAINCPNKDDELNCGVSCIDGLRCIGGTVTVDSNNPLVQLNNIKFMNKHTRFLDLSGVDLTNTEFEMENFVMLFEVTLSGCKVVDLHYKFPFGVCCMNKVYRLDLSFNLLVSLNGYNLNHDMWLNLRELNLSYNTKLEKFVNLEYENLENLDLSYTGILYLNERNFYGFPKMKYLRLRYTRLTTFHRDMFPSSMTLHTLDLRGSPIVNFFQNTYNSLIITSSLSTDNFALCCSDVRGTGVPESMCQAPKDTISSCVNLIGADTQQFILWLIATIAILGNVAVIVYRLMWDTQVLERTASLFALHLGISDLLMGVYLLMIALADVYYRGVYVMYDRAWKTSLFCMVVGILFTWSVETSIFFTLIITVNTFLALKFRDDSKILSKKAKVGVISLSWGIGFLLALISVLPIFVNDTVLTRTSMCIVLPMTKANDWGILLQVIIILNAVIISLTVFGQVWIIRSISESMMPKEAENGNASRKQDIRLAKHLSLVVSSNLCCWFCVGLIGFLSLSGQEISHVIYAWTMVFVLPVNSVINPLLYTITVLMAKWENFKYGSFRSH